jgi:hypothetical protein
VPGRVFLALLEEAGFRRASLIARTGYRTSAYTSGATFIAFPR